MTTRRELEDAGLICRRHCGTTMDDCQCAPLPYTEVVHPVDFGRCPVCGVPRSLCEGIH